MIKHVFSVLCGKSITDSASNNITLTDVLEQINISFADNKPKESICNISFPAEIVSLWFKEEAKASFSGEIKIDFLDPHGLLIKDFIQPIIIAADIKRLRTCIRLNALSIKDSGIYFFVVKFKEKKDKTYATAAKIPLEINVTYQTKTS